jgi:D-tyrosyl-tRNA(Tyr) deacylase
MKSNEASEMYKMFNKLLKSEGIKVEEGIFKADMTLNITNDGPVTIILDSKQKQS